MKAALCVVRGNDLHQTLLVNLRRYQPEQEVPFGNADDTPAWEKTTPVEVGDRIPEGWLDLLTWQSRRILLVPDGDPATPEVSRVAVLKGTSVASSFVLQGKDSMIAWRRMLKATSEEPPWLPLGFRKERAVWRDAHSLFGSLADSSVRPPILDWISELADEILDPSHCYALDVAGLCTDRAKVFSWHSESLPLPVLILKTPILYGQVKLALECAEAGEAAVRFGARCMAERLLTPQDSIGGEKRSADKKAVAQVADSLLRLQYYWAALQNGFQRLLVDLAEGGPDSLDADTGFTPPLREWILHCRQTASESMGLTSRAAGLGERTFRAIAEAEAGFGSLLNQKLPDPTAKEVIRNANGSH